MLKNLILNVAATVIVIVAIAIVAYVVWLLIAAIGDL